MGSCVCGEMNRNEMLQSGLGKSAEKYNNECISITVKHGGRVSLCLAAGIGVLLHCENAFNDFDYRRILQNGLIDSHAQMKSCYLEK